MKVKDILIMCQFFYPEYNSSSTLPTELAEDLVNAGFSVDAICGYPTEYYKGGNIPKRENHSGINIRRLRYVQICRKSNLGRLINYFSFIITIALHWPLFLKYKCILVYTNPPLLPLIPAVLNYIFGTRFVFVAFDIYPFVAVEMGSIAKGSLVEKVMNLTNRLVYDRATKIVALSTEMKEFMINNNLVRLNTDKIELIPNWYDKDKVATLTNAVNLEIQELKDSKDFIVLYSGNMGICQDMDTITACISLMREDPDVMFVLTGHGTKVEGLKSYIVENKLKNVKLFDFLTGNDYSTMLQIADCCLLSLERNVVGMAVPSKAYSYLAVGRPLIAIIPEGTDISKILKHYKAGFTLEQGDAIGLADIIRKLILNPSMCKVMGDSARKAFNENYTRKLSIDKYINMLRVIIGNTGSLDRITKQKFERNTFTSNR